MMDCRYFDKCSAPLCPRDPGLASRPWFPDEEICRARKETSGLKWIENQRKVQRKAKSVDRFFTLEMLDRDCIIRAGIEGIDSDAKDPEADLQRWLESHPERTPEQKEQARQAARDRFHSSGKANLTPAT